MTSKKIVACFSALLLIVQSPAATMAASISTTPSLQEAFSEGFSQGLDNPDQTLGDLEVGLDRLKPTYREQFHINRIAKQLEKIIEKADTNEAKMQKTINVNVLLLDTLVAKSKTIVEKGIANKDDPIAMQNLEKEMIASHFESKAKIIGGAMMQISEKYLGPQMEEYMMFVNDFQDEVNQKDINTIVQKTAGLLNMFDNAFENYAPTINQLMKEYIGVGTKDMFHHTRVLSLFGLQILMDMENKDLDPTNEYDAKDIAEITAATSYIKNALENSDEKTKAAYTVFKTLIGQGGTIKTYWENIKPSFKQEFVDMIDMGIPLITDRMESVQVRAKDVKIKSDITQIGSALAVYGSDNGNYTTLAQITNSDGLKKTLVEDTYYLTEIPETLDGSPYRFSTLQRYNIKNAAIMVMGKTENPESSNWIDEKGWNNSDSDLSSMKVEDIENSICEKITIGTKDSLKDCTALPNSTKLAYIYVY